MPNDWARLGAYVRSERRRRGMTQAAFASVMHVSTRLLGSIERGTEDRYDVDTLIAVEIVLAWQPGSAERVLAGGQPETSDRELAQIVAAWPHLSQDQREMIARLAATAAG